MKLTTPQLIIISATLLVLLILVTVIIVTDRPITTFLSALATVLPLVAVFFGLNQIKTQTNGTLSELRAELSKAQAVITALAAAATPAQVADAHDVAEDTVTRQAITDLTKQGS